jgi:glycosyltransferase involved in cell wall biosynthesis
MNSDVKHSESPRVLFFDPVNFTPGYNVALLSALSKRGCRVDVASCRAIRGDSDLALDFEFFRSSNRAGRLLLSRKRLRRLVRGVEYMVELRALRRFVKRGGYSVVHVNWLAMPALDLRFIEWLGNQGIAVVVTMHNARPHEADSLPSTYIEVCRKADRVVTLSDYVRDRIAADTGIPLASIPVVPHGDLGEYLDTTATPQPKLPDTLNGHPLVVCLGHIRPYKGVPDLIRAWPKVVDDLPAARLVIAGRLNKECEAEVNAALAEIGPCADTIHREFRFLPNERYALYLRCATVLVQPYRHASQSGNTVESYRAGVPVVCTAVGGLPEMVEGGRTGAVAKAGDTEALADAISSVLRSNLGGEMAESCRALAKQRFGWDVIGDQMINVYRQAIAGHSQDPPSIDPTLSKNPQNAAHLA